MDITIRYASITDLDNLLSFNRLNANDEDAPALSTRTGWRNLFGRSHCIVFVVEGEQSIMGYAVVSLAARSKTAVIRSLRLARDLKDWTVGRAIVGAIEILARDQAKSRIRMLIRVDAANLLQLLRGTDYQIVGGKLGLETEETSALWLEKQLS